MERQSLVRRFGRKLRRLAASLRKHKDKGSDGPRRKKRAGKNVVDHPSPVSVSAPDYALAPASAAASQREAGPSRRRRRISEAPNPQAQCRFFTKLPLELRRQIYREVWAGYLGRRSMQPASPGSNLRLHIHETEGTGLGKLGHTVCLVDPDELPAVDPQVMQAWPNLPLYDGGKYPVPPKWFLWAWCLRLRWGKHWKCQDRAMRRWDPSTGIINDLEMSPFLPMFLTCKMMYNEAIQSFFESVTPVFTSSGDAWQFFIQNPHSCLDRLRSLDLAFCHPNDYLYLHRFPADPAAAVTAPRVGDLLSRQLWVELLAGIRAQATSLKDLEITVGARMPDESEDLLEVFRPGPDGTTRASKDEKPGQEEEVVATRAWQLPGQLRVDFKVEGLRYTQTNGGEIMSSGLP